MTIVDFVMEQPPSAVLSDLSDMFEPEKLCSPIDMYQNRITEVLRYGSPIRLAEEHILGRLLALNAVSAAEAYFRAILSSCIEICPISQSIASEKTINRGGMLWHGRIVFIRSAFDHVSFGSADDLKRTTAAYIGFDLRSSVFQAPLAEYDKVCHLRHGIVVRPQCGQVEHKADGRPNAHKSRLSASTRDCCRHHHAGCYLQSGSI